MTAAPAKPQHTISLPIAVAISILSAVASGGAAYGISIQRVNTGEENTQRLERRVEKLEDAMSRITPMLERIDERTKRMAEAR
jgi:hypothetical protein